MILQPESIKEASILKKTLSRSYPNLGLYDVLQKENEKLQLELQISQSNKDVGQCQIIERLFDITEALSANYFMEKDLQKGIPTQHEYKYSDANSETAHAYDESFHKSRDASMARYACFCLSPFFVFLWAYLYRYDYSDASSFSCISYDETFHKDKDANMAVLVYFPSECQTFIQFITRKQTPLLKFS